MSPRTDNLRVAGQAGLTIIELVTALAVTSLVMAVGVTLLRNYEATQRAEVASFEAEQVIREVTMRVRNAYEVVQQGNRASQNCQGTACYLQDSTPINAKILTTCQAVPPDLAKMTIQNQPSTGGPLPFCMGQCPAGQLPVLSFFRSDSNDPAGTWRYYGYVPGRVKGAIGVQVCFALNTADSSLDLDIDVLVPRTDTTAWNYRRQQSINMTNTSNMQVYRQR